MATSRESSERELTELKREINACKKCLSKIEREVREAKSSITLVSAFFEKRGDQSDHRIRRSLPAPVQSPPASPEDDEKPALSCIRCKKEFLTKSGLVSHVRYRHAKENLHACKFCERKFQKAGIIIHEKFCAAKCFDKVTPTPVFIEPPPIEPPPIEPPPIEPPSIEPPPIEPPPIEPHPIEPPPIEPPPIEPPPIEPPPIQPPPIQPPVFKRFFPGPTTRRSKFLARSKIPIPLEKTTKCKMQGE